MLTPNDIERLNASYARVLCFEAGFCLIVAVATGDAYSAEEATALDPALGEWISHPGAKTFYSATDFLMNRARQRREQERVR